MVYKTPAHIDVLTAELQKRRRVRERRLAKSYGQGLNKLSKRMTRCRNVCLTKRKTPAGQAVCGVRCVSKYKAAVLKRRGRYHYARSVDYVRRMKPSMRQHLRGVMQQHWATKWAGRRKAPRAKRVKLAQVVI